nr:immunoglobulin light chain junction region [Macaca mulatta]
CQQHNAYPCTF